MRNIFISFTFLFLSGCAAHEALQDMRQAKAAYKACIAANPKDHAVCKQEKETYEATGQAYDSLHP
jgi:uncharacterized protein YceK